MSKNQNRKVTIIIPSYNEYENISNLIERINKSTSTLKTIDFEIMFVDDGSKDSSIELIQEISNKYKNIKAIQLSRNFGSHIAISAGIENVINSDSVIVLSADLQEPPEKIQKIIEEWDKGFDIVWTIRKKRSQGILSKFFSYLFYKLFINYSELKDYPKAGPSGFFLLDKKVYKHWHRFKESNRMVLGMISWMGFNQSSIEYEQDKRMYGKSSYNFFKLLKIALDSFIGYSFAPIRAISFIGIIISFFSFLYAAYLIFGKLYYDTALTGWTSTIVIILFLGGLQLVTLGIIGEYVWRGVNESRNRPLYIISKKINFD